MLLLWTPCNYLHHPFDCEERDLLSLLIIMSPPPGTVTGSQEVPGPCFLNGWRKCLAEGRIYLKSAAQVLTLRSRFSTRLHVSFLLSLTLGNLLHFPGLQCLYFGRDPSGAFLFWALCALAHQLFEKTRVCALLATRWHGWPNIRESKKKGEGGGRGGECIALN